MVGKEGVTMADSVEELSKPELIALVRRLKQRIAALEAHRDADAPGMPLLNLDDSGRLTQDLECIKCGYNLRGALAEGRCPECGLAVGRSAKGHWLRYCDPDWLRRIWGGLNRLAILIVCAVGAVFLFWSGLVDLNTPLPEWLAMLLPLVLICTGIVVGIHGIWCATAPDPAQLQEASRFNSRRVTRWALVCAVVTLPLFLCLQIPLRIMSARHATDPLLISYFLWILTAGTLLWYGRSLAKRIPLTKLARVTTILSICLTASGVLGLWCSNNWFGWWDAVQRLYIFLMPSSPQIAGFAPYSPSIFRGYGHNAIYGWIFLIGTCSAWAFIASIVLLAPLFVWYWIAMSRQARIARATWAKEPHKAPVVGSGSSSPTQEAPSDGTLRVSR